MNEDKDIPNPHAVENVSRFTGVASIESKLPEMEAIVAANVETVAV